MKKEDNPLYIPKIQKILNKLISEEVIASNFYSGCITATCKCQSELFKDLFIEIAVDELDDHAKNMIEWAITNDYDVPFTFHDYEKFAEKNTVKQFNSLKKGQDAKYYVSEGIESEKSAIASYQEALECNEIPQDLNAILLQNFYDEVEHLENLETLLMGVEAEVNINII